MKTIYNDNFLGGTLILYVEEERKRVTGVLRVYDPFTDKFYSFKAQSKCQKSDVWSEKKGIDIVETKLSRDFHNMYLKWAAEDMRMLEQALKVVKDEYEFRKKKVTNIEEDLNKHYGLTYWRKKTPKKKK